MKSLDSNQMRLQNKLGLVVTIEGGNALLREIVYNWAKPFLNSQLLTYLFLLSIQSSSKFIIRWKKILKMVLKKIQKFRKYFVKTFQHKKKIYMYEIFRKLWLRCDWIHTHPPTILILPCKTLINISIRGFQKLNLQWGIPKQP